MQFTYFPKGVCSTKIDLEIEDGIVRHVHFTGGCDGNLKAVKACGWRMCKSVCPAFIAA